MNYVYMIIYIYIYKDGQNQDNMEAAMDSVEHVSYSPLINELYIYMTEPGSHESCHGQCRTREL